MHLRPATPTIPAFTGQPDTSIPEAPTQSKLLTRRFPAYPDHFTFEPSSRRVRGIAGDVAVVDSRHQILVWEPGHKVPEYGFPLEHVRTDLLEQAARPAIADSFWRPRHADVRWFDLITADRRIPGAAWQWNVPGLERYIAVSWYPGVLDAWYEEDEPVITHPRDPGNRVDVAPSSRHVEVAHRGHKLADSTRPLMLFENRLPTRLYLPEQDVDWSRLEAVDITSTCPYKGIADRYWSYTGDQQEIAWSYSAPFHQVSAIAGLIAFYSERVEITVDGAPFLDSPQTWA